MTDSLGERERNGAPYYSGKSAASIVYLLALSDGPLTTAEVADLIGSNIAATGTKLRRMYRGGLAIRRRRPREHCRSDRGQQPYEYALSAPGDVRRDGEYYAPTASPVLVHRVAWAPRPISPTAVINTIRPEMTGEDTQITGTFTLLYRAGFFDREQYPSPVRNNVGRYKYVLADPTDDADETDT